MPRKMLALAEIRKLSRWQDATGYIRVHVGWDHPQAMRSQPTAMEHRLKMEAKLGRRLRGRSEHVHHRNGDKSDNRMSNLKLVTPKQHGVEHRSLPTIACQACGKKFYRCPSVRRKKGCGRYCSPKCGATSPARRRSAARNLTGRKPNIALNRRVYKQKQGGATWREVADSNGFSVGTARDRYRWHKENIIDGG